MQQATLIRHHEMVQLGFGSPVQRADSFAFFQYKLLNFVFDLCPLKANETTYSASPEYWHSLHIVFTNFRLLFN